MKIKATIKRVKSATSAGLQKLKTLFFRWKYKTGIFFKEYGNTVIAFSISATLSFIMYRKMSDITNKEYDYKKVLEILLTINGAFSAILITYLFNRITWKKDRKLDLYNEAQSISNKITDFRRILNKLTSYYNVWENDNATHGLLHIGQYKEIDYYEFEKQSRSDYKSHQQELIDKLIASPNFNYGSTVWYLAMISFAVQRHSEFVYHQELYKDYNYKGVYTLEAVERWIDCDILGAIGYYKYKNAQVINYSALRVENAEYILDAAKRINKKYESRQLDNSLILDIAEELNILYLPNLRSCLVALGKGIRSLELLITVLILSSLLFGVLIPVILLILSTKENWFHYTVSFISAINIGLILFFILKLPFFINKELKWS